MVGFTPEQIIEIRRGRATFDAKLDALARVVRSIATERGHADPALVDNFLGAGWAQGKLVAVIVVIGDKTVTNDPHGATKVPAGFPAAPALNA